MAKTWQSSQSSLFRSNFQATVKEGSAPELTYQVRRLGDRLEYSTAISSGLHSTLPVESIVGGARHGLSFLERIDQLGGVSLQRSALVEARYAFNTPHNALALSPGFDPEKPTDYEDTLGRTLSPSFERKCLACHGQPVIPAVGTKGGVRCESCHRSTADHLNSVTAKAAPSGDVVKPATLKGEEQLEVCGECHSGLADRSDPVPDDLLVSNQVPALRNSECFLQSGHALTCTGCHDPHRDSKEVAANSVATCLGCHSKSAQQSAGICPVNARGGCVGCHMPGIEKNSFLMTDHWIRVHPEQGVQGSGHDNSLKSHIGPKHEFLRMIVVETREAAEVALQRLRKGEPFAQVAHQISVDPTAPGGGYIGDMNLSQMDVKLAAATASLSAGEVSAIVDLGNRFIILYRLPRDFKWQADQFFQQATSLRKTGDLKGAANRDQQALDIYPYFLRALVFMGTTIARSGDTQRASAILQFASESYPKDPAAQFDYALTLVSEPQHQIEAFQHALELDPDMVAAYESLGVAQFSSGQQQSAIATFRKGLEIDPLSASLNYNLSLAHSQQGDEAGAKQALVLAQELDPKILLKRSPGSAKQ